jgi:hypothetical protein
MPWGNSMNPELAELLTKLGTDRFYGSVELKFEAGKLVMIRRTENLKPADLYRNNRGNYERNQSS